MTAGLLLIDKPPGRSSAGALEPLKRLAGKGVRVGHTGTLDPFATGLLLALVGDATRLSAWAMRLDKTYRATVQFGIATDTLDPEGAVTARADAGPEPPPELETSLGRFLGEIEQIPPVYSALKVGGRRAYVLARSGRKPDLAPRKVAIHAARLVALEWPHAQIELICGKGTYLRSLARDWGAALGLPAHLRALRRTRIGPFDVAEAAPPDRLRFADLRGGDALLAAAGMEFVELDEVAALDFVAGRALERPATETEVAVTCERRLLGIGTAGPGGRLRSKLVLASARKAVENRALRGGGGLG